MTSTTDPLTQPYHIEMKRAYLMLSYGRIDEAKAILQQLINAEPDMPLAWTFYGTTLLAAGQTQDALRFQMGVVEHFPEDALARLYLSEACFFCGRFRRAWRELDHAEKLDCAKRWTKFAGALRETWSDLSKRDVGQPLTITYTERMIDEDRK